MKNPQAFLCFGTVGTPVHFSLGVDIEPDTGTCDCAVEPRAPERNRAWRKKITVNSLFVDIVSNRMDVIF